MRWSRGAVLAAASALSLLSMAASLRSGAYPVAWADVFSSTPGGAIFWDVRVPRVLFGFLAGGMLGIAGAAMQGLFRNPLADPSLLGITSGASLGAASAIALLPAWAMGLWLLPAAAFAGAWAATWAAMALTGSRGDRPASSLLLAGIAVNALAGAGIGWIVFGSTETQLRDFTFWSLGSLSGAGWPQLLTGTVAVAIAGALLISQARGLNALTLGESDAGYLGVATERVRRRVVLATALGAGSVTAFAGVIGFIGLVAPHVVRMLAGADHRLLLPASFCAGGVLVCLADSLARTVAAPAEIPVGVVAATAGAPVFVYLLRLLNSP